MTVVAKILSAALELSFTATRAAGAFSLSPSLAVTRHINRSKSPAFKFFNNFPNEFSFESTARQTLPGYGEYMKFPDEDSDGAFFLLK
jgi:hypothetical protein